MKRTLAGALGVLAMALVAWQLVSGPTVRDHPEASDARAPFGPGALRELARELRPDAWVPVRKAYLRGEGTLDLLRVAGTVRIWLDGDRYRLEVEPEAGVEGVWALDGEGGWRRWGHGGVRALEDSERTLLAAERDQLYLLLDSIVLAPFVTPSSEVHFVGWTHRTETGGSWAKFQAREAAWPRATGWFTHDGGHAGKPDDLRLGPPGVVRLHDIDFVAGAQVAYDWRLQDWPVELPPGTAAWPRRVDGHRIGHGEDGRRLPERLLALRLEALRINEPVDPALFRRAP